MVENLKPLKLGKGFFERQARIVAKELLGKVLVRKIRGKMLKARIVETEVYLGKEDPGSRVSRGRNKISEMMWSAGGTIMIYNVHKYNMFNIVTGRENVPEAVLIRALEPLNFSERLSGPGLLTENLKIDKRLHGKLISEDLELWIEDGEGDDFEIMKSHRIGLTKDLSEELRFYIKDNKFLSKKKPDGSYNVQRKNPNNKNGKK